jgi:hypothetical protein
VPSASGHVFIFCAPRMGSAVPFSCFALRTHFLRYRGRHVPFSCFARLDSFSAVLRASGPVFMFCTPRLIFGGTEGVKSRFHVLHSLTRFRRFRGRRVPFSSFARPDSFSAVPRASGPVFMFCVLGHVFGGAECLRSRFHVLCPQTLFRRFRGRQVLFSCFTLPDSFSAIPRASGLDFMFCLPRLVFGGTEGVGSRLHILRAGLFFGSTEGVDCLFHVLRSWTRFGGTESVGSHFHVLLARTRFWRYCGRRVPFSCFALPDSFSAVPRASDHVLMFCTLLLVFGGSEGVGSRFQVLCGRTYFSAIPRAPGPVFMFSAPEIVSHGTEGVRSRFHVLRSRTHFRRYRGRRVPFSCFPLPESFSAVLRVSGPVFMFCTP